MIKVILACITFTAFSALAESASTTTTLNDGQIAKVLLEIHDAETDMGELAEDKTDKPAVKEFAKMMIDQHSQAEKNTKNVVSKNKLDTAKSELSKTLEDDLDKVEKDLKKTDKAAFDKKYVDAMVAGHEKVLATLDNTLIPAAQNTDMKDLLAKTRLSVTTHLDHAKKLQSRLQ